MSTPRHQERKEGVLNSFITFKLYLLRTDIKVKVSTTLSAATTLASMTSKQKILVLQVQVYLAKHFYDSCSQTLLEVLMLCQDLIRIVNKANGNQDQTNMTKTQKK